RTDRLRSKGMHRWTAPQYDKRVKRPPITVLHPADVWHNVYQTRSGWPKNDWASAQLGRLRPTRRVGKRREGKARGRNWFASWRLQGRPVLVQRGFDVRRHSARRHHWRLAGPRRCERGRHSAAAHVSHGSDAGGHDVGHHPPVVHLLGGLVRRG